MLLDTWSKMLSTSRDALLKLFKTTSPQKLFPSDCITLYTEIGTVSWVKNCPPVSLGPPFPTIMNKLNQNYIFRMQLDDLNNFDYDRMRIHQNLPYAYEPGLGSPNPGLQL